MWGMMKCIRRCLVDYDIGGEGGGESFEVGRVAGDIVISYCCDVQG
jgi:hypothetical protein